MPTEPVGRVEPLGTVTCPSGRLLILDGGLAWLWSHNRPPLVKPEWHKEAESMNAAVDLAIRGPDARRAGRAYDRSNNPLFRYDIPVATVEDSCRHFDDFARQHGFDARAEVLSERVSHHQRLDLVLKDEASLGAVEFHGMWAAGAGRLPIGTPLQVWGERMPRGENEERWRRICVQAREGEVVSSRAVGHVLVDMARLLLIDAEAIGQWNDHEPPDGLADLVFWGRDAEAAARKLGVGRQALPGEEGLFGWVDLPLEKARQYRKKVKALPEEWKFAVDLRPHTQHWQLMRHVRASSTASGALRMGEADTILFMTSWGDGAFPVEADLDGQGRLLKLRIELGNEQTVTRYRRLKELWFGELSKAALVSARVAREGKGVRWLYREKGDRPEDSGWRVFAGDETEKYNNDARNIVIMPLRELIVRDASLEPLFRTPSPCAFERKLVTDPFVQVSDFD